MEVSQTRRGPLLFFEVTGPLTKNDFVAFLAGLESNANYSLVSGILLHLNKVEWKMSAQELEDLAKTHQLRPIRWALVAEGDFSFSLAQQFARQAQGGATFKVFRDEETALNWLFTSASR